MLSHEIGLGSSTGYSIVHHQFEFAKPTAVFNESNDVSLIKKFYIFDSYSIYRSFHVTMKMNCSS